MQKKRHANLNERVAQPVPAKKGGNHWHERRPGLEIKEYRLQILRRKPRENFDKSVDQAETVALSGISPKLRQPICLNQFPVHKKEQKVTRGAKSVGRYGSAQTAVHKCGSAKVPKSLGVRVTAVRTREPSKKQSTDAAVSRRLLTEQSFSDTQKLIRHLLN
jgi:hypothetical protein